MYLIHRVSALKWMILGQKCLFLALLDDDRGAQLLEGVAITDVKVLHEGVEGLGRVLTVRALAGHANADAGGDVADAAGPHEAVEGGIDADLF